MNNSMGWIEIKNGLPEDADQLCLVAEFYKDWPGVINSFVGTVNQIKKFRSYELKNSYTHYLLLSDPREAINKI